MSGPGALIAFVPATDLVRARAFYGVTLGLALVEENPYACVFDVGGTMLRVTQVPEAPSADHTVLGWAVADIEAAMGDLGGVGVGFERYEGLPQDDAGVWTTPGGDRIAWFKDPDGNTLSLTQFVHGGRNGTRLEA